MKRALRMKIDGAEKWKGRPFLASTPCVQDNDKVTIQGENRSREGQSAGSHNRCLRRHSRSTVVDILRVKDRLFKGYSEHFQVIIFDDLDDVKVAVYELFLFVSQEFFTDDKRPTLVVTNMYNLGLYRPCVF
ncbi:hypothetical protein TNIN_297831 [Trichonephila inaurata madagascariensis]|uniref:Uncharacterized protein n=1 Tax=Trichonephila inaurata madagascariensis TaxID=2747483 RepID=A0A8X6Y8P8_9ARAC|nr:hypothetical protein TNIN_297831 [Trichonephila inaurata madagascariensis]